MAILRCHPGLFSLARADAALNFLNAAALPPLSYFCLDFGFLAFEAPISAGPASSVANASA